VEMMIKTHDITLTKKNLFLRPMSNSDVELLVKWNSDPDVLYYSEGDDVSSYTQEDVEAIYGSISQAAYCFIIVYDEQEIGECWLQQMNLQRIKDKFTDCDCRRIDIMIGEKSCWGKGIGTRVIKLLAHYGFETEQADAIFACDVADYNERSRKAFERAGFELFETIECPKGRKAKVVYDLILRNPAKKSS
jgi:aminoglycoside 6'-N-acetyltransferase